MAPERLIDTPIESLPYLDRHTVTVRAGARTTWDALVATERGFGRGRARQSVSRALGAAHTEVAGKAGEIGSTIPGFVVARSIAPAVLALLGRHRFSRYALVFRIVEDPNGHSELSAETRAEFPGAKGSVYRTLVVGTRGHVLATRGILSAVRRRAER